MPTLGELLPDCPAGAAGVTVSRASVAAAAAPGDLLFVADPQADPLPADCPAAAVLVEPGLEKKVAAFVGAVVPLTDARDRFLALLPRLNPRADASRKGVSKAAHVHPSAAVGPGAEVHAGATVSAHAVIGANCRVFPGAFVGPNCTLGDGVTLHPNCVLHDGVRLADGVTVQAGAVVGQDGFGFESSADGHRHLPHHGGVEIGKGVLVGANSTVARGMIADTVLGAGTALDAQVVVAHNCDIGPHNLFCSQAGLAGSVTTGAFVIIAGQGGVADHVTLGDHVTVGSKAGVHRDCKAGVTLLGSPAQPKEAEAKMFMASRKLPEMRRTVKELRAQVAAPPRRPPAGSTASGPRPAAAAWTTRPERSADRRSSGSGSGSSGPGGPGKSPA